MVTVTTTGTISTIIVQYNNNIVHYRDTVEFRPNGVSVKGCSKNIKSPPVNTFENNGNKFNVDFWCVQLALLVMSYAYGNGQRGKLDRSCLE